LSTSIVKGRESVKPLLCPLFGFVIIGLRCRMLMAKPSLLSILIPLHNEEAFIAGLFKYPLNATLLVGMELELIMAGSASTGGKK
jgi:hypothetical protein